MSRTAFKLAAMEQRVCAVTGTAGRAFHAHHVVRKTDVQANGGDPDDTRNALRLTMKAHFDHHWGNRQIELRELTDANIEFACELLGELGPDYLRQRYAGDDPRLESEARA